MHSVPRHERVRAIIISSGNILLIKRRRGDETYWVLPGGGVEEGEGSEEALKRECFEEIGLTVHVDRLFFERPSDKPETRGDIEFFFLCHVLGGVIGTGTGPEFQINSPYVGTYEIEWVKIDDIPRIDLRPHEVRNLIYTEIRSTAPGNSE